MEETEIGITTLTATVVGTVMMTAVAIERAEAARTTAGGEAGDRMMTVVVTTIVAVRKSRLVAVAAGMQGVVVEAEEAEVEVERTEGVVAEGRTRPTTGPRPQKAPHPCHNVDERLLDGMYMHPGMSNIRPCKPSRLVRTTVL